MLEKSLSTKSDVIIYDLEDSVPPSTNDKDAARKRLKNFLGSKNKLPLPERIALGIPSIRTLVLPKIHSAQDLHHVSREIYTARRTGPSGRAPLSIVASIESARALWALGDIAGWKSEYGPDLGGKLSALLVCINYKDMDYLKEECEDGRRLGFNGKQAIHPNQAELIQSTFVPTSKEILRAAKIVHQMERSHALEKGAFGLDLEGGGKEMIDAPMLKQAEITIAIAKAAGIEIPHIE
ncbi:hypothetical protein HWV62_42428 [Athelia sp. TMB]|nr:hypothetical protein HWV62_42428 [Athelia sp. TMB]